MGAGVAWRFRRPLDPAIRRAMIARFRISCGLEAD